jgi:Ring finger domain
MLSTLYNNTIVKGIVSVSAAYLGIKTINYISRRLPNYPIINSLISLLKLGLLYTTNSVLRTSNIPLSSFPLYIFDWYIYLSSAYMVGSTIISLIGFPAFTGLYYYADYLIYRLYQNRILVNGQPQELDQIITILSNFTQALSHYQNYSLNFRDIELKSYRVNGRISLDELNLLCPLFSGENSVAANDTSCSICAEKVEPRQLHRRLPCEHIFHAHCIDEWLLLHRSCPNCRREL